MYKSSSYDKLRPKFSLVYKSGSSKAKWHNIFKWKFYFYSMAREYLTTVILRFLGKFIWYFYKKANTQKWAISKMLVNKKKKYTEEKLQPFVLLKGFYF